MPGRASRSPAATANVDDRPLVDVAVLADLVGDDEAIVARFLAEFLRAARGQAEEIAAACAAGDAERVGAVAHKLKASSRAVGARALGDACAELEVAGQRGRRDEIVEGCRRVAQSMRDVDAFIARRLGAD